MSRIPFSRSDVDDLVSGSHIFKKRFSLNNRLRARLPKSRVKYLFGIVVVVLFLFGSQLTACGYSTVSPTGSGSPTSNTTSIPNTPGSRSGPGSTSASTSTAVPTTHPTVIPTTNPTAGPTTHPTAVPTTNPTAEPTTDPTAGPTTDPTAVPTAPPSSFTVSQMNLDFTCSAAGQCNPSPQPIEIDNNNKSIPILPINWSVQVTWDPTNSPPQPANDLLSVHPSSGTLDKPSDQVNIKASNSKAHLPPGSYIANLVWCPPNKDDPNHIVTVTLTVVSSAPSVSGISPPMGSASTSVTITGSGFTGATSVQCHLNKKNVAEALLFEGKSLLPRSLAMERGISALDNTRVKAEAAWGQQGGRFAQIRQQALLQPRDLLARDQGKLIAGGVQHLNGMREAETIGVQVGLAGGLMHPPAHEVMGQEQPVEFLAHQTRILTA